MADTPVLERRTSSAQQDERDYAATSRTDNVNAARVNAAQREAYEKLINPNLSIDEVLGDRRTMAVNKETTAYTAPRATARVEEAKPYLVTGARANSALFRADSAINRVAAVDNIAVQVDEEEEDDLRPTATTRQYRTVDVEQQKSVSHAKIHLKDVIKLDKRQKIMVVVFASIIVGLILLVAINAIIIANLNYDIAQTQSKIAEINIEIAKSEQTLKESLQQFIVNNNVK